MYICKNNNLKLITFLFLEAISSFSLQSFILFDCFTKPQKELPLVAFLRQEKQIKKNERISVSIWAKSVLTR